MILARVAQSDLSSPCFFVSSNITKMLLPCSCCLLFLMPNPGALASPPAKASAAAVLVDSWSSCCVVCGTFAMLSFSFVHC